MSDNLSEDGVEVSNIEIQDEGESRSFAGFVLRTLLDSGEPARLEDLIAIWHSESRLVDSGASLQELECLADQGVIISGPIFGQVSLSQEYLDRLISMERD